LRTPLGMAFLCLLCALLPLWSELTNNTLRKQKWGTLLCPQIWMPPSAYARGIGVNTPPLSLIFCKTLLPAQRRLIVFACFCLLICRLTANTTEWVCMQFQGTLQTGQKVIIRFLWESGLSSASRNHLTTFCRPFVHYACFRLCSAIVYFIRNNCLNLQWLISEGADRPCITGCAPASPAAHFLCSTARIRWDISAALFFSCK